MSPDRTSRLLLRLYPAGWRARYGEELEALIFDSNGRRVPWRVRVDVAKAAGCERLRGAGLAGDGSPGERMRAGSLLVLCAWALFVVAGCGVQKFSEHWQDVTPSAARALPAGAFEVLVLTAAIGSALVLAGIAATLPSVVRFLRDGGWLLVRRRIGVAALMSVVAVPVTVALIVWARGLTPLQRNGNDLGYGILFSVWALLLVVCLAAWAAAAVATARRLDLSPLVLKLEAGLAAAVALGMGVMTVATVIWWGALAQVAPWFLAGKAIGSSGSALAPELLALTVLMLAATIIATSGAVRALHALPALDKGEIR